ncbi:hypothetical protein V8E51_015093 [Hyaloscypha variabilis]
MYARKFYGLQHSRFDALGTIIYTHIQRKAVRRASFEARSNALHALLEIGMSIMWASSSDFAKDARANPIPKEIGNAPAIILSGMTKEEKKSVSQTKDWLEDVENLQKSAGEDDVNFCLSSAMLLCRLAGGKTASEVSAFEDGEVDQFHIACACLNGIRFGCALQLSRFSLFSDGIDSTGLGHLVSISTKSCPWLAVARLRPRAARGFRISTRVSATTVFFLSIDIYLCFLSEALSPFAETLELRGQPLTFPK